MTSARADRRRTAVVIGIGFALVAAAVWLWPGGSGADRHPRGACSRAIVDSTSPRWPSCRRPYSSYSPFNRPLGRSPRLAAGSSAIVSRLLKAGPLGAEVVGDKARDGGVPFYRSRPGDPLYRLHCTRHWGRCELEGAKVRIPAAANPAGVWPRQGPSDAHLTVVDPHTLQEYDLWNVSSKRRGGGRLAFGWGGRTSLTGNGLGSGAVAAGYGGMAGVVRAREFVSGRINHALAMVVPCTRGVVYPARGKGLTCSSAGLPEKGAPPMGARFRLALSEQEIESLQLPRSQQGILRALARYGAYVSDTSGAADQWGFEQESEASYSSFGETDPRIALARRLGYAPLDYNHNGEPEYWLPYSGAIDWSRLQVIAPCAARGSCS
jgi:hypothetical protein